MRQIMFPNGLILAYTAYKINDMLYWRESRPSGLWGLVV